MLTAELDLGLAHAAIGLPGWRWMPGMLAVRVEPLLYCSEGADPAANVGRGYRVHGVDVDADSVRCTMECFRLSSRSFAPDYRDPATAGCLLHMLGEDAWRIEKAAAGMGWLHVEELRPGQDHAGADCYPTLGAACIRAAIAAGGWGRRC